MPHQQTPRIRGVSPEVQVAARSLRRALTPAERALWRALRRRQWHGLYFRRQYPVGPFILDFCCPAHKLVVELDGAVHDSVEQAARDAARTEQLQAHGYSVIRFRNEEVLYELPLVLTRIAKETVPHGNRR